MNFITQFSINIYTRRVKQLRKEACLVLEGMMKIVVYSYSDERKPYFNGIEETYGVEVAYCRQAPSMENVDQAKGAQAICVVTTPVDKDLIQAFYDIGVRYISTRNVGYDHIDVAYAKSIGMGVGNSSYAPNSVAEYAMMMILMATRKGAIITEAFKRNDYSLPGKMGMLLQTSTVGVIGTGKIGMALIDMLAGFGCKILAYDPYPNKNINGQAQYVDLEELIEESQVISLHVPLTEASTHLIDADHIKKMKDGVIIVNTARGGLIDTEALIQGLESKKIGAAALDVLEGEQPYYYRNFEGKPVPLEAIEKLNAYPNVILTPHTAFYTSDALYEMTQNGMKGCVFEMQGKENPWKIV
jgi:D-lactate dehydrogenase